MDHMLFIESIKSLYIGYTSNMYEECSLHCRMVIMLALKPDCLLQSKLEFTVLLYFQGQLKAVFQRGVHKVIWIYI